MKLAQETEFVSLKPNYFECECCSSEHTLRASWYEEGNSIYFEVFLKPQRLCKRIWAATKYVLGHKSKYGHFDEFMLQAKDAPRFTRLLQKLTTDEV